MKQDHQKELDVRDEKLELLKSQLEKNMDEKSWYGAVKGAEEGGIPRPPAHE